jgi:hypothetical protein
LLAGEGVACVVLPYVIMQSTFLRPTLVVLLGLVPACSDSSTGIQNHTDYKNRFGAPSYLESAACEAVGEPCRTIANSAPCGDCDVITVDDMSDGTTVSTCFADGIELCDFDSDGGGGVSGDGGTGTSLDCTDNVPPPDHADWSCFRCVDDTGVVVEEGCVPPPIPCVNDMCPDGYECSHWSGCLECEIEPPPICVAIPASPPA